MKQLSGLLLSFPKRAFSSHSQGAEQSWSLLTAELWPRRTLFQALGTSTRRPPGTIHGRYLLREKDRSEVTLQGSWNDSCATCVIPRAPPQSSLGPREAAGAGRGDGVGVDPAFRGSWEGAGDPGLRQCDWHRHTVRRQCNRDNIILFWGVAGRRNESIKASLGAW